MKNRRNWRAAKADALWGNIIHIRDGHCYLCGGTYVLEAHHLFRRSQTSHPDIRFTPRYGVLLCLLCHDLVEDSPTAFWGLLKQAMCAEPDRWAEISGLRQRALPIYRGTYNWPEIVAELTVRKAALLATSWMDQGDNLPEKGQY